MVSYHPQYGNGSQSIKRRKITWSPAKDTQEVLLVLTSATTHLHKGIYPRSSSSCSAPSISGSTQHRPVLLSAVRIRTEANSSSKSFVRTHSIHAAIQKAALCTTGVKEASLAQAAHAHAWTYAVEGGIDVWRNTQWAKDR